MTIYKNKKMIFFDMGNTLLDFHQGISDDEKDELGIQAVHAYLQTIKKEVCLDDIRSKFLNGLYSQFHLRVSDLIEIDVEPYINKLGSFTPDEIKSIIRAFYSVYKETVVVNNSAVELLRHLKKESLKIGVISNCFLPAFIYEEIFVDKGLDAYIDSYTFSYTHGIRKPNPNLFRFALDKNQVKASEVLMIGDGLKPDIEGSSKLGIQGIWYNIKNKKNHEEIIYLKEIHDFIELIE